MILLSIITRPLAISNKTYLW